MLKQEINIQKEGTWNIIGVHQVTGPNRNWTARVEWHCTDAEGNIIDHKTIEYSGAAYNEFWDKYINGAFLLSELIKTLGITATIPEDIEDSFINQI